MIDLVDTIGLSAYSCGTKVLVRLLTKRGMTVVAAKTLRSLFQEHHVLPRVVFRRFGSSLTKLGVEQDALSNLILLPRNRAAQALVRTSRSTHNGFSALHSAYNDRISARVAAVLEKWTQNRITGSQAKVAIQAIQQELKGELRKGEISLVGNSLFSIGTSGLMMVGPFMAVEEGSEAHQYFESVDRYKRQVADLIEVQEVQMKYSGGGLTFGYHFPESWARHIDWVNPFSMTSSAAGLGILFHMPDLPEIPAGLAADLEFMTEVNAELETQE